MVGDSGEAFAQQGIERIGRQLLANLPGAGRWGEDHGDSFRLDRDTSSVSQHPHDSRFRPTKERLFTVPLYEKAAHSPPISPAILRHRELLMHQPQNIRGYWQNSKRAVYVTPPQ